MIKLLTMLLAGLLMFSSVAEAGSCPMKMGQINKALETGAVKNVAMVKKLLAEGKAAHESGQQECRFAPQSHKGWRHINGAI